MILIADSGSTKCDWVMVEPNGQRAGMYKTMGFNPYFHSAELIASTLKQDKDLGRVANDVTHVYFYGAGCSSPHLVAIVEEGLKAVFPKAQAKVEHDLLGAAYATWDGHPAITGILGTGSNSCYFDGKELREEVPALAYILGDEGSGSYFGKKLLSAYLYKRLPASIAEDFKATFQLTKDEIVENVYNKPHANVYLAGFMRFISTRKDDPYFQEMIEQGLMDFLTIHVKCFEEHKDVPVHFVGSIAHYFEAPLSRAMDDLGLTMGAIQKQPIDGLVNYHIDHQFKVQLDRHLSRI